MFCPNCGAKIQENARFCENCGAPVQQSVSQNDTFSEHMTQQVHSILSGTPATADEAKTQKIGFLAVTKILILIAIICFFFPFMTVSCGGQQIASVSGTDMIFGDSTVSHEVTEYAEKQGETEEDGSLFNWFVLAAGVCAVFALFTTKNSGGEALFSAIWLIVFRFNAKWYYRIGDTKLSELNEDVIQVKFGGALYLAIVLLLAVFLIYILFYKRFWEVKEEEKFSDLPPVEKIGFLFRSAVGIILAIGIILVIVSGTGILDDSSSRDKNANQYQNQVSDLAAGDSLVVLPFMNKHPDLQTFGDLEEALGEPDAIVPHEEGCAAYQYGDVYFIGTIPYSYDGQTINPEIYSMESKSISFIRVENHALFANNLQLGMTFREMCEYVAFDDSHPTEMCQGGYDYWNTGRVELDGVVYTLSIAFSDDSYDAVSLSAGISLLTA